MFGFNIDRKALYIVFIILIMYTLVNMTGAELLSILLTLPAVILAISFHEFAHAFAAVKLGDTTPKNQGRLTLNPLKHIDPFGFFLLMFARIGWGRPVQINPNNFTSNKSREKCEIIVSIAGPITNFILAILAVLIRCLLYVFAYSFISYSKIGFALDNFLYIFVCINIGLGVFNLIPLPPLDGEKIFRNSLPRKIRFWLEDNYQTLYWIFMLLWITGLLGTIISPVIDVIHNLLYVGVSSLINLFI